MENNKNFDPEQKELEEMVSSMRKSEYKDKIFSFIIPMCIILTILVFAAINTLTCNFLW